MISKIQTIEINPDFRKLIPPLSPDEFSQLEENCIRDGIREPLTLWNGVLIDGHNRYEVAKKHGLNFRVDNMDFADENEVKIWMIDNQKGRRNLSDFVKYELSQVKAEILREKGREKQRESGKLFGEGHSKSEALSTIDKTSETHDTRQEVAADLNWSTGKVAMADVVNKKADEETKDRLRRNEISINQAYKSVKNGVHFTSDSEEWYTPEEVINATLKLFGGVIDLDPCSNDRENPNVPADNHYTKNDNGLSKDWSGRVYMNPPYGRAIVEWIEKAADEHEKGNTIESVLLVPARTDTNWMVRLRNYPRCFIRGRLKFSNAPDAAPFPSCVVYLGENEKGFYNAFSDLGDCFKLIEI